MNKRMSLKDKIDQVFKSSHKEDHKYPTTRRDLIKYGLLAGGGSMLPLSFIEMSLAQIVSKPTIPVLVFDLAGGASLAGNFLVGQKGGSMDLFPSYNQHGWNPREKEALDDTFGLPMSANYSKILEGLKKSLPSELLKNNQSFLKFTSVCNYSISDTKINELSPLTLISKCGLVGKFQQLGIGGINSVSGGNSAPLLIDKRFSPLVIGPNTKMSELTSFGDEYAQLPKETQKKLMNSLIKATNNPQLKEVYSQLANMGNPEPDLDPFNDPSTVKIYDLNNAQLPLDQINRNKVEAAVACNVIKRNTGPGVITVAGCDYHDTVDITKGDRIDETIGLSIGRAISLAASHKTPLFIHIITDGGNYAKGSERIWVGDENGHSLSIMGFFNPKGNIKQSKTQIGSYTSTGVVDQTTLIGSQTDKTAVVALVNYMNLNGLLEHIDLLSGMRVQANEIDDFLVFA